MSAGYYMESEFDALRIAFETREQLVFWLEKNEIPSDEVMSDLDADGVHYGQDLYIAELHDLVRKEEGTQWEN